MGGIDDGLKKAGAARAYVCGAIGGRDGELVLDERKSRRRDKSPAGARRK